LRESEAANRKLRNEYRQTKQQATADLAARDARITLLEGQLKTINGKARMAVKNWQGMYIYIHCIRLLLFFHVCARFSKNLVVTN
jgi:hypothetical protein